MESNTLEDTEIFLLSNKTKCEDSLNHVEYDNKFIIIINMIITKRLYRKYSRIENLPLL